MVWPAFGTVTGSAMSVRQRRSAPPIGRRRGGAHVVDHHLLDRRRGPIPGTRSADRVPHRLRGHASVARVEPRAHHLRELRPGLATLLGDLVAEQRHRTGRVGEGERPQHVGIRPREFHGDHPAHRMADEVDLAEVERSDETGDVGDVAPHGERLAAPVPRLGPVMVQARRDHPAGPRQRVDLLPPQSVIDECAVDQHHRLSGPLVHVGERIAVDPDAPDPRRNRP